MPSIIEFLVKMNDMASGPLTKLGNTGNNVFTRLESKMSSFRGQFTTLGASINDIDRKLNELTHTRNMSIDSSQIERLNKAIDALQTKKDKLTGNKSGSGGMGLGGFLNQGLAIAGVGGLGFLGKDIMQKGMERQLNQTSFEVLLGKQPGDQVNNSLLDFAKKSIYGNEVFTEGKLLAGSGTKAGNIMPIMNMIGDIAMGDKERMKSIALAFSEASSTGKLTGRQNLMFRTALFNPLTQLAAMTHKSVPQLEKDMEKGKISINDLVKSMEYATGPMGRWYKWMEKAQNSDAGKITAFSGSVSTLAGTLGLKLLPVLGSVADFMSGIINDTSALTNIGGAIAAMSGAWLAYTGIVNGAKIANLALQGAAYWPLAAVGVLGAAFADLQQYNIDYAKSNETVALSSEKFIGPHIFILGEI